MEISCYWILRVLDNERRGWMRVSLKKKIAIFIVWLLILPVGLWLTYQYYPPQINGLEVDIAIFFLLMAFVAAIPMVINGSPVFLIQWVSWAVFLIFGLFVEIVMAQMALIILFISVKLAKDQFFRIPLNSLLFFGVSLLSGLIYYKLGGSTGSSLIPGDQSFWLIAIYPVLYYLFNHVFIIIFNIILNKNKQHFGKDFVWETVTTIITFPIGFVLYILYKEVGLLSLLFVSIPFASLSIILNLYFTSGKINANLQKATEIGHELAERLHVDNVIDLFINRVSEMLTVDFAFILDVVNNEKLVLIRRVEEGIVRSNEKWSLKKNEGISGISWGSEKAALYNSRLEWHHISKGYMPENAESILSIPMIRNNEVVAVLTLGSSQKRAYEKSQLMIVEILCSYFAIAVENARHYEETKAKSEHCALTKIFNYYYFENLLNREFTRLNNREITQLSLIILDIDHFKSVNDTYGHQSGNEILCELASALTKMIPEVGTVARYGGEEFVILLPNVNKTAALKLAEEIRYSIALHPFILKQHLENETGNIKVNITASIGVAAAPQDAEDPISLLRHADRALYVGAKRAGRNRVAEYVK